MSAEERQPSRRQFLGLGAGAASGLAGLGLLGSAANAQPGRGRPADRVRTGVEVLLEDQPDVLQGKKIGLITNPTGVLPDLGHEVDAMNDLRPRIDLVAILAPEHGFRGEAQAGESGETYEDPRTGIPVYDLYGQDPDGIAEIAEEARVDLLVFDIQDVGSRFYTYIWTMSDAMEAAAGSGLEFVVLDRPNPIGGLDAEGPVLEEEYSTFVGRYPISQRHGMTAGEIALMFNEEFVPGRAGGEKADLSVVWMDGWRRDMLYEDTGLPWVLPSPNMPTPQTAMVYPGTCMFEGTNLSEGRGTVRPFELIGAPYVDGELTDALRRREVAGTSLREAYFAPTFSKYEGETVGGVQLYATDPYAFEPIRAALAMILEIRRLYPDDFEWRYDSWAEDHPYWIDKLTGSDYVRRAVDSGNTPEEIVAGWQEELDKFRGLREGYLAYRGGGRPDNPGRSPRR